eukprot:s1715_g8.t1
MTSPWTSQPPYGGSGSFTAKYVAMCFCKRVRFEVNAEPVTSKICDCTICQRLHGAPAQWAALFAKSAVRFSAVSLQHLRWYHVQTDTVCINGAERVLPSKVQCSHCGTWVADEGRTALEGNMFMTFPTLFDFGERRGPERYPASFRPRCHIFCGSRSLSFEDGLPNYLDDCRTPLSISDAVAQGVLNRRLDSDDVNPATTTAAVTTTNHRHHDDDDVVVEQEEDQEQEEEKEEEEEEQEEQE